MKTETRSDIRNELEELADSEARIMLLFATREEALEIMGAAHDLGLTSKNYVWIASQSVVGTKPELPHEQFPPGMLSTYEIQYVNIYLYLPNVLISNTFLQFKIECIQFQICN